MCRAVEDYYNKIIAERESVLSLKFDKEKEVLNQEFDNKQITILITQLNRSLGKISDETIERIRRSSKEIVEELLMNIFDIHSEEDIINRIENYDRGYLLV